MDIKKIIIAFLSLTLLVSLTASRFTFRTIEINGYKVSTAKTMIETGSIIDANIFDGTQWGTPTTISLSETASNPRLAGVAYGENLFAVAIWTEIKNEKCCLFGAMLPDITGKWEPALQISGDDEDVSSSNINLRISNSGKILTNWTSNDDLGGESCLSSESIVGINSSWGLPQIVCSQFTNQEKNFLAQTKTDEKKAETVFEDKKAAEKDSSQLKTTLKSDHSQKK